MRYVFDNDLHIHTYLSSCSRVPEQNTDTIIRYAEKNDLKRVCITDHFWDENVPGASGWYAPQNYAHISSNLPLPVSEKTVMKFGCETDLDRNCVLGIDRKTFDMFDFVIIPTTHLHMGGFTCRGDEDAKERAELYVRRLDAVLNMDIPFRKIGIAHLTCPLIYTENYTAVLDLIPDSEYIRLFSKMTELGAGFELNFNSIGLEGAAKDSELRPYIIAKEVNCRFYFGSDAHSPGGLDFEKNNAEHIIDLLGLTEEDKWEFPDHM